MINLENLEFSRGEDYMNSSRFVFCRHGAGHDDDMVNLLYCAI